MWLTAGGNKPDPEVVPRAGNRQPNVFLLLEGAQTHELIVLKHCSDWGVSALLTAGTKAARCRRQSVFGRGLAGTIEGDLDELGCVIREYLGGHVVRLRKNDETR